MTLGSRDAAILHGLTSDFIYARTRGQKCASQAQSRHKFSFPQSPVASEIRVFRASYCFPPEKRCPERTIRIDDRFYCCADMARTGEGMDLGLRGSVIAVTGGGAGIGQGILRTCVTEGARVVVLSQNLEHVLSISTKMRKTPDLNRSRQGDVK